MVSSGNIYPLKKNNGRPGVTCRGDVDDDNGRDGLLGKVSDGQLLKFPAGIGVGVAVFTEHYFN